MGGWRELEYSTAWMSLDEEGFGWMGYLSSD